MSLLQGLLLAALGALVVLHVAGPRFRRQRLSAARFFRDLPPVDDARRRFRLGNPLRSRPLYPQLAILGLLAAALMSVHGCEREPEEQLGVWVLLDTSHSMTTLLGRPGEDVRDDGTRLGSARREIRRFLDKAAQVGPRPPCFRFSTFDMEIDPLWPEPIERGALEQRLAAIEARPLGTDVSLLRGLGEPAPGTVDDSRNACPAQVRLVVSDVPAPDWVGEPGSGWVWRDVGKPVDNVGLAWIEAVRDPFGGRVDAVVVEVAYYGSPPDGVRLEVRNAENQRIDAMDVEWSVDGVWRSEITVPDPGRYHLRLTPGGAYLGDDEAVIEIPEGNLLRVDWRLPSRQWVDRLGWERTASDADLTVLPLSQAGSEVSAERPVLIVGDQYGRGPEAEIAFFEPDSPILDGLNFDVAEGARILGIGTPPGFEPVLAGRRLDQEVWVARRETPRGIYVPGLPAGGDSSLGRFSATLFIRSLRWLLSGTPPPPLYTLTSPAHPEVSGSRIALHEDEGRTDHSPLSRGDLDDLALAVQPPPKEAPPWPWWLAAAAGVFLVEQLLLAYGGEGWR